MKLTKQTGAKVMIDTSKHDNGEMLFNENFFLDVNDDNDDESDDDDNREIGDFMMVRWRMRTKREM